MTQALDATGNDSPDTSLRDPLPASPLPTLARWLEEARACDGIRNHDAMALATVDREGRPHVRMVLCRRFDADRGTFAFYTNRTSPKGDQLEAADRASAVIHWDALARQVRIEGRVTRATEADSDAYFAGRHPRSQIAAWASEQSRPIESRTALLAKFDAASLRFEGEDSVERPPDWGGYVITADRIELWVEQPGRLHDRGAWVRDPDDAHPRFQVARLQP